MVLLVIGTLIHITIGDSLVLEPDKGIVDPYAALTQRAMVVDGLDPISGLVVDAGFEAVRANCTNCHSGKLVTQNRMTRSGWHQTIIWMQQTQGLWDLGDQQKVILDYLEKHYAPTDVGRRANLILAQEEWYRLD